MLDAREQLLRPERRVLLGRIVLRRILAGSAGDWLVDGGAPGTSPAWPPSSAAPPQAVAAIPIPSPSAARLVISLIERAR